MINRRLEEEARLVREAHDQLTAPIDPLVIAKGERINLAPSPSYGEHFEGRLEYHSGHDDPWILFHKTRVSGDLSNRDRFTVAHELGHFFLEDHRSLYLSGESHSSTAGFVSDNKLEREADAFAGALLLPSEYLEKRLDRREFMSLKEISKMAGEWKVSLQSAVIRYVEFTGETCVAIVANDSRINYSICSDQAQNTGMKWVDQIPEYSNTFQLHRAGFAADPFLEGKTDRSDWFRYGEGELHEEVMYLSEWGLSITLLSVG
ncbi:MAG: hypothetical protein CML13_06700 [Puniceicoccaceae bacterium]|nr:hypothetical protein [Puniceicoccaceae bacterium]|tara:strand:- start:884 stop:1669 length:786 start_codon:yes stop_codon:yes gene_type:complete